jgi:predicted nucleic acid-binding protein
MIYFDSTFLLKLLVAEADSPKVVQYVQRQNDVIASSAIARTEVVAALHRKHREGAIPHSAMLKAHSQFLREIEVGRVVSISFTRSVIDRVEEAFQKLPTTIFLRAGDAIHLATAVEAGFKEIYSNDRRLLAAAPHFKLKGVNPLAK